MSVLLTSIGTALLQAAMMLALAKIIGPAEYGRYSLAFSISVFLGGVVFEWARLSLPRLCSSRCQRFSAAIITGLSNFVDAATIFLVSIAGALWFLFGREAAHPLIGACVTVCVLLAAGGTTDFFLTRLRFGFSPRIYNYAALGRSVITGLAAVLAGLMFHTGTASASAFGLTSICYTHVMRRCLSQEPVRPAQVRHLLGFWRYGAAASAGTIATTAAFGLGRTGITAGVGLVEAGKIFLSLDLLTRGVLVMGNALSTWGTKAIFAGVSGGRSKGEESFSRVALVFTACWLSAGMLGAIAAFWLPVLVSPGARLAGVALILANMLAIMVHGYRLYLLDPYLLAMGRVSDLAFASVVLGSSAFACTILNFSCPTVAPYALPASVAVATTIYLSRSNRAFRLPVFSEVGWIAAIKLALVAPATIVAAHVFGLTWGAAVGIFIAIVADAVLLGKHGRAILHTLRST